MKRTLLGAILALILVAGVMLPAASASAETTQTKTMQIPSTQPWTDTGLTVSPGDKITITASGNVNWGEGSLVGPDGRSYATSCLCCHLIPSIGAGKTFALVGNISDIAIPIDGKGFFVGSNFAGTVGVAPIADTTQTSGKLILGFNDTGITPPEPACTRTGIDWGTWNDNSGFFTVTITITPASVLPDLTVVDVKPVQVVWECDINGDDKVDLVQGKLTDCVVRIGGFHTLSDDQTVEISLIVEGISQTMSTTVAKLKGNNTVIFTYIPRTSGDGILTAMVDPSNQISELNESNNSLSWGVTVKNTHGLGIAYCRVGSKTEWEGLWESFTETSLNSADFIHTTYPVTEDECTTLLTKERILASDFPWNLGMAADCSKVWLLAKRLGYDRGVGIVSSQYFAKHSSSAAGIRFEHMNGVLSEVDWWTVPAHEIGHTYGLPVGKKEEYDEDTAGNAASGRWVSKGQTIEGKYCFMGDTGRPEKFRDWICLECYERLFDQLLVDKEDPEVLLINGTLFRDGRIDVGTWYRVDGFVDLADVSPGDCDVVVADKNQNILQQMSFHPEFWANVDPLGTVELDFAPFGFALPYVEGSATVRISYKGELKAEIDLSAKLCNDAMSSLLSDYESLLDALDETDIEPGLRDTLKSQIANAKTAAETGTALIHQGKAVEGNAFLNAASGIVGAFLADVTAQKGSGIPADDADQLIEWTQKMILPLQDQLDNAITSGEFPGGEENPPAGPSIPGITGWGAMGAVILLGALAVWMLRRKRAYTNQ